MAQQNSTLALLMSTIITDDSYNTISFNNFAFSAYFFD
jgi:hypothetical protein